MGNNVAETTLLPQRLTLRTISPKIFRLLSLPRTQTDFPRRIANAGMHRLEVPGQ